MAAGAESQPLRQIGNLHPSSSSLPQNAGYGSVEGEHYSIPIKCLSVAEEAEQGFGFVSSSTVGSSLDASTVASTEGELERDSISSNTLNPVDLFFCRVLGFVENPLKSTTATGECNSAAADLRLAMLSNFSTAYNILSISLALPMMQPLYATTTTISAADSSLCSSALIAGMIVGQVAGGTLGDVLGRHRAMTLVMFLQVFSSFFSALSCPLHVPGSGTTRTFLSIYHVLAMWRFVLGLGAGGVYPLAATLTAESSNSDKERAKSVALTFSSQGLGYLAVPVVAYLIVTFGSGASSDLSWRLLLGLGAVPGTVLTIIRTRRLPNIKKRLTFAQDLSAAATSKAPTESSQPRIVPVSVLDAVWMEKDLFRKMMGTGGCWLLFDILFYGNTLFQPMVLSAAFGAAETVQKMARDSAILALMALPGYFVSVHAVGKLSPQFIQIQGFFVMGILYLCIGVLFELLASYKIGLLVVYGATFFFSNYGPNATTYMLPSMTYSRACRSTLNGVCAACGKTGALIGTMVFCAAAERYGQKVVFLACALLSFVGCIITMACVSSKAGVAKSGSTGNSYFKSEQERLQEEERLSSVPVILVYSQPSLMDYLEDAK